MANADDNSRVSSGSCPVQRRRGESQATGDTARHDCEPVGGAHPLHILAAHGIDVASDRRADRRVPRRTRGSRAEPRSEEVRYLRGLPRPGGARPSLVLELSRREAAAAGADAAGRARVSLRPRIPGSSGPRRVQGRRHPGRACSSRRGAHSGASGISRRPRHVPAGRCSSGPGRAGAVLDRGTAVLARLPPAGSALRAGGGGSTRPGRRRGPPPRVPAAEEVGGEPSWLRGGAGRPGVRLHGHRRRRHVRLRIASPQRSSRPERCRRPRGGRGPARAPRASRPQRVDSGILASMLIPAIRSRSLQALHDGTPKRRGCVAPPCRRRLGTSRRLSLVPPGVETYGSSSLPSRAVARRRPASPITARYATCTVREAPSVPESKPRMSATPWYSGEHSTRTCSQPG